MKFVFSAEVESPSARSIFHFRIKELGLEPKFQQNRVVVEYEGTAKDETFRKVAELYETQPIHLITIST